MIYPLCLTLLLAAAPATVLGQGVSKDRVRAVKTTATIAALAIPATVTILAIGARGDTLALGSGFIIRSEGVVVTNWHVLRGASRATIRLAGGEEFIDPKLLAGDSLADIALLAVDAINLPVVTTTTEVPPAGERVVAIGSPMGLSETVSEGIVSAQRVYRGKQLVQISAPISPGSSGGVVLDKFGRAFAVSTSYLEGGQQLNFAVPVRYGLTLLEGAGAPKALADVFGGYAQPRDGLALLKGQAERFIRSRRSDSLLASLNAILPLDTSMAVSFALEEARTRQDSKDYRGSDSFVAFAARYGDPAARDRAAAFMLQGVTLMLQPPQNWTALVDTTRAILALADPVGRVAPIANHFLGLSFVNLIAAADRDAERRKSCELARQVDRMTADAQVAFDAARAYVAGAGARAQMVEYLAGMRPRTSSMVRAYCR